jgi:hypothetical protein
MSIRRYRFKSIDQRTGRLERAVTLLEDGEIPRLKTRDPDPRHPLSTPRVVGLDRAQVVTGMQGEAKREDQQLKIVVGFTTDTSLLGERGIPAFALYSGGCVIDYEEA